MPYMVLYDIAVYDSSCGVRVEIATMNVLHNWFCQSDGWRKVISKRVPWALKDLPLGSDVLEIGPGFGAVTDLLQPVVERLTCVEIDRELARRLERRMFGKNVTVLCGDGTSLSLPSCSFDAVVCFTMLHHVPSPELQDLLLSEAARVLRPGGVFAGVDSAYSWRLRLLHVFDTMVVVGPETFPGRLRRAGFAEIELETAASAFRFRARKPQVAAAATELVQ
jgi:SAM-dependent methyltransferase